jgi:hypothetical protein
MMWSGVRLPASVGGVPARCSMFWFLLLFALFILLPTATTAQLTRA